MEEGEGGKQLSQMADEDDFEPAVRPKQITVGVVSKELSEPDLFDEIWEFMWWSKRTETILLIKTLNSWAIIRDGPIRF